MAFISAADLERSKLNYFNPNSEYIYLNKDRSIGIEKKEKGILTTLQHLFYSIFYGRDYSLANVLVHLTESGYFQEFKDYKKHVLLEKTFKVLNFDRKEAFDLAVLCKNESIELSSKTNYDKFNEKLHANNNVLNQLFTAFKCKNVFSSLKKITYKINHLTQVEVQKSKFTPKELYQIDKLADFYDFIESQYKIQLKGDDPFFIACKKSDQKRKDIFEDLKKHETKADIIEYDAKTIHAANLWKYNSLELLYFKLKSSTTGHIAVEYRTNEGASRLSHMMENYENSAKKLHHTLFKGYQLDLMKLLTDEANQSLIVKYGSEEEVKKWLRDQYDTITSSHIEESQETLKKSENSALNQIGCAFSFHRSPFVRDHKKLKEYKPSLLCSEYAQKNLTNTLTLLENKLKESLQTHNEMIHLPIDGHDRDYAAPADFHRKWESVLTLVPSHHIDYTEIAS